VLLTIVLVSHYFIKIVILLVLTFFTLILVSPGFNGTCQDVKFLTTGCIGMFLFYDALLILCSHTNH